MTQRIFGTDVIATTDLDPQFRLVSGGQNVAYALARRLRTGRGKLFYARNYGLDLAAYVHEEISRQKLVQIKNDVSRECLKDDRVKSVRVSVQWDPVEKSIVVKVNGFGTSGPFALVLSIDDVSVEILRAEAT